MRDLVFILNESYHARVGMVGQLGYGECVRLSPSVVFMSEGSSRLRWHTENRRCGQALSYAGTDNKTIAEARRVVGVVTQGPIGGEVVECAAPYVN